MTNILVTAMLLTGGSAVLTSLTGVHTAASCFLLPIGVVLYTLFGGIKATFITDYMHTVVIIVVIFIFAFSAYATNAELGSPGKVYDALVAASELHPVEGNAQGSYLTMRSKEGGIFWVINLVGMYPRAAQYNNTSSDRCFAGNFGLVTYIIRTSRQIADDCNSTVFLDNGYYNKGASTLFLKEQLGEEDTN